MCYLIAIIFHILNKARFNTHLITAYLDTILDVLYISLTYPKFARARIELNFVNLDRLSVKSSNPVTLPAPAPSIAEMEECIHQSTG